MHRGARHQGNSEYIQISLDVVYALTGMLTKGSDHLDYWAKQATISYSTDCMNYVDDNTVCNKTIILIQFHYHADCACYVNLEIIVVVLILIQIYYTHYYKFAPTAVKFKQQVTAKCIRITPTAYEHKKILKVELTGYPKGMTEVMSLTKPYLNVKYIMIFQYR